MADNCKCNQFNVKFSDIAFRDEHGNAHIHARDVDCFIIKREKEKKK